jgi:hypothetical protein
MVPDPKRWARSLTLMFMIAAEREYSPSAAPAAEARAPDAREAHRLADIFA